MPIITVQSKPGTYGHCTTSKVWKNKDSQQYEMNIAAEMLSVEIEEVLDTLIHEMVHLYCRENGIQEVSRGGKYHNGKFKALAEEKGLVCYKAGQYGWNTQGHDNDKLTEMALEKGWSEIKISRGGYQRISIPAGEHEQQRGGHTARGRQTAQQHKEIPVSVLQKQRESHKDSQSYLRGLHGENGGGRMRQTKEYQMSIRCYFPGIDNKTQHYQGNAAKGHCKMD